MVNRQSLKRMMTQAFGEDDAAGAWSMRDAYDALETAQVLCLADPQSPLLAGTPADIFQRLRQFERALPTQTYRSEKQVDLQQFSTPISLAWLAAMAARCRSDDILLEPSAGTGMLVEGALPRQKCSFELSVASSKMFPSQRRRENQNVEGEHGNTGGVDLGGPRSISLSGAQGKEPHTR
ncbi:hypothetical protein [Sphingobium xenophagum]